MARVKSLRILFRFDWPDGRVTRLWDGAGPFVDADRAVWKGAGLITGSLDAIEQAINGDAASLSVTLSGVSAETGDAFYDYYRGGGFTGATLKLLILACDDSDQPVGSAKVVYSGSLDNVVFDEGVSDDRPTASVTVDVTNRFSLRLASNGASLSDVDQRARSAKLNPDAPPDRFAERVPLMNGKTLTWPRFS